MIISTGLITFTFLSFYSFSLSLFFLQLELESIDQRLNNGVCWRKKMRWSAGHGFSLCRHSVFQTCSASKESQYIYNKRGLFKVYLGILKGRQIEFVLTNSPMFQIKSWAYNPRKWEHLGNSCRLISTAAAAAVGYWTCKQDLEVVCWFASPNIGYKVLSQTGYRWWNYCSSKHFGGWP